jgi:omega-hydroxy-beta-dihydromenaquinone-9 sulfotransferase
MSKFHNYPILPHIGSSFVNFGKVIGNGTVKPRFYIKVFFTFLFILVATPFHVWDYIGFRKKLKEYKFLKDPLFLIGHWRSGTTLVHNFLCQDKTAGYLTTYQSLFPNNLKSKLLFKTFVNIGIPSKRPSDNMAMNANYPQEDELALGNVQPIFYYNFFYFPSLYSEFYDKAVRMQCPANEKNAWRKAYISLMKKAAIDTKGERPIMKNPVNTARIQAILDMFPDAKFLFVYRNPYTVFFSSQRFFHNLLPSVWLNKVDKTFIDQMILDVYVRMMDDYDAQKQWIPYGNLLELRFEEFEKKPVEILNTIYTDLLKEDFGRVRETFIQYQKSIKKYEKNSYVVNKNTVNVIDQHWKKFIQIWNYKIPEEIIVS